MSSQKAYTELPRITSSLRAFSGLSSPFLVNNEDDLPAELKRKREWKSNLERKKEFSWQDLNRLVKKNIERGKEKEVNNVLRDLLNVAYDIVGKDASSEVTKSSATFLFQLLRECASLTKNEVRKIEETFGPCDSRFLDQAFFYTQQLMSYIPEEAWNKELMEKSSNRTTGQEFGHGTKFSYPDTAKGSDEIEFVISDSDSEDETPKFSMNPEKWVAKDTISTKTITRVENTPRTNSKTEGKFDANWLKQKCDLYFGAGSGNVNSFDMCSVIFDLLSSPRNDAEMQNELFELLGFDRFEFIQELLANRVDIVVGNLQAPDIVKEYASKNKTASTRPNFGCQVTIQSEQEKQLMKQVRKEERRGWQRDKGQDVVSHEEYLKGVGFDPEVMKYQREQALVEASNTPLFSNNSRATRTAVKYPYVFDSLISAQRSGAYVGGSKLALPFNTTRRDFQMYEEFTIPPTDSKPPKETNNFIDIASMDEIGKIGFAGMKRLNRVQSVVFDTAYNTNENLLICAPTGAGKTNVAMLTILREIKQNVKHGVVMKDKFKIIYVAPMKALAAEMVKTFGKRLAPLGVSVRELTGDMQLTKNEIRNTQMLVTTPEKWDVVTRKSSGDVALAQIVKLLIIDEVHLLHDERGSVIECLVARTIRQVESTQTMIRIVGLSATLPNYLDVARFLRVNPHLGLFFFDSRFRPVPLGQTFIGVKSRKIMQQLQDMDTVCFEKVLENVEDGHQVMVFVHARNATVRTAMTLREKANNTGTSGLFQCKQTPQFGTAEKQVRKSRNKELRELFQDGFSIHHAGMLRSDRSMVEDLFGKGLIKVLVCTATLAWGVNLPAHAVIIKGTEIYDAKKGSFVDLGILDVLQIFGRAGRPQFDQFGSGYIITKHDKLSHYLSLMTRQSPIESQFLESLADSLNAEVSLGTITSVDEAVEWLSYTYLHIRMLVNPLVYGIAHDAKEHDPCLDNHRRRLIVGSARALDKAKMIRFDERTSYLSPIDIGRTASNFYIKYDTIETINETFRQYMTDEDIFNMISLAQEFEQIKVREEEQSELIQHSREDCFFTPKGGAENSNGKTNILLQTYISKGFVHCFSLASDFSYIAQNAARIVRGLFELALKFGWPCMASRLLTLSKCIDKRMWFFENPLRQFPILPFEIVTKLEKKEATLERLKDMDIKEIGQLVHHVRMGKTVKLCVDQFPSLSIVSNIQPVTRSVLRVRLTLTAEFQWNDRVHGGTSEPWWIWVEDPENDHLYHSEYFLLLKKQVQNNEPQSLVFTIPIFEPLPSQYLVHAISDRWLGAESVCAISFKHLMLPEKHPPHTDLLDLQPLPLSALRNPFYEQLFKFSHFNPVQTQVFHTLYHTDHNVLLGSPTGSGKTIAAELAIFRVFNEFPNKKAVYIAPLKALVRERIEDWKIRFEQKLKKKVVELTGDVTPDMRAISKADVIVTTPEKWDGVSRSWQTRNYVQDVSLIVIDEIHLLGDERGPVLEVIVSRTNFISSHTEQGVRIVGLSTALANARDLADWLGIKQVGLFNFRPSVRPVPLQVHIHGFPEKHYCPRMATMNKPTFAAIRTHSPEKPVLIFVSSRRQTRLTALDLIAYLAAENDPKQWLHMPEPEIANVVSGMRDENLRLILSFGIAIHHAGLHERDRKVVEELFVNQKIQVLIATSTLAWGVNFPAHLVVVKGTEYFDGKTRRYIDFPVTDVLQMMGRAGRPQFDDQGVAVIFVHDIKKQFYKKFLYDPFPVESSLPEVLADHISAEIVSGTITSKQEALDYITWTYFFRRLLMNPSYYNLESVEHDEVNKYLSSVVQACVGELEKSYCLEIEEDDQTVNPTILGRISSYYYLSHLSLRMFRENLHANNTLPEILKVLTDAAEYDQLPVRHNEDALNSDLAKTVPLEVGQYTYDCPHTKTHLLLQAHFSRLTLPCSDYFTDTKSVLDQSIRILQAMIDVSADEGWLATVLRNMLLVQMVVQARWIHDCPLLTLPGIEKSHLDLFQVSHSSSRQRLCVDSLPELAEVVRKDENYLGRILKDTLSQREIIQIKEVLFQIPRIEMNLFVRGVWEGSSEQQQKNVNSGTSRVGKEQWIQVHADQEYVVRVELSRLPNSGKKLESKAHAPRFPKSKDEGWWVVLGEVDSGELLALKRVGFVRKHSVVSLAFFTPEETGHKIYTLYFMSDSYMGLDQQLDIHLDVVEASIESQVNSELES